LEKYIVLKLKVSKSVPCTVEENMRITYGKKCRIKSKCALCSEKYVFGRTRRTARQLWEDKLPGYVPIPRHLPQRE
jgi:hypothetical protein